MPISKIISWQEHARKRPGMYIGGTDERALAGCVSELIANSMEQCMAGRGTCIMISIHADGSVSVKDDGGGIPVELDQQHKIPFIELAFTMINVHGDHFRPPYQVLGSCGVGARCVNALSEWMRVNTVWEGMEYQISFARGQTAEPLTKLSENNLGRGTVVRFKADGSIFKTADIDKNRLAIQLDHLAILHPDIQFWLVDERPNSANRPLVVHFHYPNGIADFLDLTCPFDWLKESTPCLLQHEKDGIKIELGFQFTRLDNSTLLSFANSSPTRKGGTHVQGFLKGLADVFNELADPKPPFQPKDIRMNLNACIGVWLAEPHYAGSTRDELGNEEVETSIREFVVGSVKRWLADSGQKAKWLVEWLDEKRRADVEPNG